MTKFSVWWHKSWTTWPLKTRLYSKNSEIFKLFYCHFKSLQRFCRQSWEKNTVIARPGTWTKRDLTHITYILTNVPVWWQQSWIISPLKTWQATILKSLNFFYYHLKFCRYFAAHPKERILSKPDLGTFLSFSTKWGSFAQLIIAWL